MKGGTDRLEVDTDWRYDSERVSLSSGRVFTVSTKTRRKDVQVNAPFWDLKKKNFLKTKQRGKKQDNSAK